MPLLKKWIAIAANTNTYDEIILEPDQKVISFAIAPKSTETVPRTSCEFSLLTQDEGFGYFGKEGIIWNDGALGKSLSDILQVKTVKNTKTLARARINNQDDSAHIFYLNVVIED